MISSPPTSVEFTERQGLREAQQAGQRRSAVAADSMSPGLSERAPCVLPASRGLVKAPGNLQQGGNLLACPSCAFLHLRADKPFPPALGAGKQERQRPCVLKASPTPRSLSSASLPLPRLPVWTALCLRSPFFPSRRPRED